jgi:hypothetical protein
VQPRRGTEVARMLGIVLRTVSCLATVVCWC